MRNSKGMDIMKKAYNQALLTDQPYALIAMNIKKISFYRIYIWYKACCGDFEPDYGGSESCIE